PSAPPALVPGTTAVRGSADHRRHGPNRPVLTRTFADTSNLQIGRRLSRPLCSPFKQFVKRGTHPLSPFGQGILDLWRYLRKDGAADDAIALQFAKLLNQHLLRDARNSLFQLGEAQYTAGEEMEDDDHLPPPFQHAECGLDAACRHVGGD